LGEKWLELLKEIAPRVERVGVLMHPDEPINVQFFKFAEAAAPALKVKPVALGVHDVDEIKRALTAFAAEGKGGFIVIPHAVTLFNRDLIVALATRLRLPAVYPFAFYAKAGGISTEYCAVHSPPTCRCNTRRSFSWSSISRPRRRWGLRYRDQFCPWLTN
jgi:putative ABC transport system substrate-binding protein